MAQWNAPTQSFNNKDSDVPGRNDFTSVVIADHQGRLAPWHPDFTSKNRLKVSDSTTAFWTTFNNYPDTDIWDSVTTGTGAVYINNNSPTPETFDPDNPGANVVVEKSVVIRVSTAGDKVIRQSSRTIPYFPGKAQVVSQAINLGGHVDLIQKRIGLFDENNGFFFECSGNKYNCVVRKNGVDTVRVAQENWNGDRLNGNGKSGITLNPAAQQLLAIEYEWYGTGSIRFGFVINNEWNIIHTVENANETIGTWAKTANLPIRLEVEALTGYSAGDAYVYQSSTAVTTEGSREEGGILNTAITGINYGTTPPTVSMALDNMPAANNFYPLVSLKMKDAALDSYVSLKNFQIWNHSNAHMTYVVLKNATTLTGATFAISDDNWVGGVVDQAATGVDFTSDQVLFAGHSVESNQPVEIPQDALVQLGRKFTNPGSPDFASLESDVITIAAATMQANVSAYASITWVEQP